MTIGSKIRRLREQRGFKQSTVSSELRMSQANYAKIESDIIDVKTSTLMKIAAVLDIEVASIFTDTSKADISHSLRDPAKEELLNQIIRSKETELVVLRMQIENDQQRIARRNEKIHELREQLKNKEAIIAGLEQTIEALKTKLYLYTDTSPVSI
ncbi:helix-turn-helix domain-containing protein [Ohtaekwangia kribbensis]|jgi:transcriptional regulator with XRE-family HTH domain|uniref:Helix-turn-helix domain-containing protein n=1 Tax=Ohtaekwangia kribbensis TaxID=688913 RepID=A0ABW3K620_9BACT